MTESDVEILYFTAPRCRVCKTMSPFVEGLATEYEGRVHTTRIDSSMDPERARSMNVRGVPTLIVVADGVESGRVIGAQTPGALRRFYDNAVEGEVRRRELTSTDRLLRIGAAAAFAAFAVATGEPFLWFFVVAALVFAFWDKIRR